MKEFRFDATPQTRRTGAARQVIDRRAKVVLKQRLHPHETVEIGSVHKLDNKIPVAVRPSTPARAGTEKEQLSLAQSGQLRLQGLEQNADLDGYRRHSPRYARLLFTVNPAAVLRSSPRQLLRP